MDREQARELARRGRSPGTRAIHASGDHRCRGDVLPLLVLRAGRRGGPGRARHAVGVGRVLPVRHRDDRNHPDRARRVGGPPLHRDRRRQRGHDVLPEPDGRRRRSRDRRVPVHHVRQRLPVWPHLPARLPGADHRGVHVRARDVGVLVAAHRHRRRLPHRPRRPADLRERAGGAHQGSQAARRRREPREGPVRRQREPRDANAAERRDRDGRHPSRDRPLGGAARDRRDDDDVGAASPRADRGRARHGQDRGRPRAGRVAAVRSCRLAVVHRQGDRAAGAVQGHRRPDGGRGRRVAMVRGGLAPPAPGAPEPPLERDQVHGARADRHPRGRRRYGGRARQAPASGSGGHRHRHRARQAGQDLRGVHAGRRLDHEDLRRDRPRNDDRKEPRALDGRRDRRRRARRARAACSGSSSTFRSRSRRGST